MNQKNVRSAKTSKEEYICLVNNILISEKLISLIYYKEPFNAKDPRHQQEWKDMQVVLNSGKYVAYPSSDGNFELYIKKKI